ncbi:MAG: SurA N-terminal domain-containing protein [Bacteroidaceae bacterium]|nr:SurA N-terminal domain-containing protein [Bacteroidaceae bacterium]
MATLQKIRSKGALLILFVGLALFAFIAEEAVRSLSSSRTESHQRIGKIYGKSMNIQDFNALVDEYVDVVKFTSGSDNLTEEQMQQVRDQVWQTYVQSELLNHEAEQLGLTVTDAEMQEIIKNGQNPLLQQTPFRNQQTGVFDVEQLNQFLTQYNAIKGQAGQPAEAVAYYSQMYNYWKFVEKNIRQQALAEKFQGLLGKSFIANPVSAENAFKASRNEKDVLLVALPYTSVKDEEVTPEAKELTAKYNELKDLFRIQEPVRDIKYIDVAVQASKADRDQINAEMQEVATQLAEADADIANIVRKSGSTVAYNALPVRRAALPADIASQIDSLSVGQQKGPYLNAQDNTQNIVRLIAKTTLPDSVRYRQIGVSGADEAAAQKTADSIMTVLASGVPFDSIAKKFNQTGEEMWVSSAQYENATLDENNQKFISALSTQAVGTTQQVKLNGNAIAILRVTDRRNPVEKYQVAIVKRPLDFSNETFNKTFNDFSQFIASNKTIEDIEANALKAGYMVQQREGMFASEHNVAGLSSTREAFRWIFNNDTKVGDVSDIYTVGNNDHLLVVMLTDKNNGEYRSEDGVKDYLTTEVTRDKKAAKLQELMASANDLAAVAKLQGATAIDTVRHITFGSPVFISGVGASESALAGAVAKTAKGSFAKGVKGNAGVYAFQVVNETNNGAKLDDNAKKTASNQVAQQAMRAASRFMQELYEKAGIQDKRYIFY